MPKVEVLSGDCREIIPTLGVTVDSIVCDPPYNIAFMNRTWDSDGVAFDPATWETISKALKPGGYLLAFGGTRTYHRMACAIEEAGFVIQDCLMWLFATGFPKNKAHLKPAYEPIVLAYKPGGKRTLQVDECRIPTNGESLGDPSRFNGADKKLSDGWIRPHKLDDELMAERQAGAFDRAAALGRWPATIITDGSDEVVALFPESAGQRGDVRGDEPSKPFGQSFGTMSLDTLPFNARNDGGSAARFFFSAKAGAQDRWGSKHPTVKPVELMKWLVALVTPLSVDGRPGLVLDPFAGSGTTGVAALAAGRNAILIERDQTYCDDIRERLAFYEGGGTHSVQAKNRNRKVDHGPLFAPAPLTADEMETDSIGSYHAAMTAIGEKVKAGAPVPEFLQSRRKGRA